MSLYLQGTLPWLFDPDSPELGTLAREAAARTSATVRAAPSSRQSRAA